MMKSQMPFLPKAQDICSSFKEFDIEISMTDITNPTVSGVLNLYTRVVAHALGYNMNGLVQLQFNEENSLQEPELYDSFAQRSKVFLYLKILSDTVGFDFCITDFMRPESDRLIRFLSLLLQFMKHKQHKLSNFREISSNLLSCSQAFEVAQRERQNAEVRRQEGEVKAQAVRQRISELRLQYEEKTAALRALKEHQRSLLSKEKDAGTTLIEVKKRTEQLYRDAEILKQRAENTKSKIAPNPSALVKERDRLLIEKESANAAMRQAEFEIAVTISRREILDKSLAKLNKRALAIKECEELVQMIVKQSVDQKDLLTNAELAAQKLQKLTEEVEAYSRTIESSKRNLISVDTIYADRIANLNAQLAELETAAAEREPERVEIVKKIQIFESQKFENEKMIAHVEDEAKKRIAEFEDKQSKLYDLVETITKNFINQIQGQNLVNASQLNPSNSMQPNFMADSGKNFQIADSSQHSIPVAHN
eukprot:GDKJ01036067.1.p1 GENE.GDKJ01036067.1~~GDKJ01036067.1.p1  ORF type:complete len:489 (-),score=100.13 GDKJ01036067.1:75-1514(-)